MKTWISREQRRSRAAIWQKITLITLLVAALALVEIRYHRNIITFYNSLIRKSNPGEVHRDVKSEQLFKEIMSDLGLGQAPLAKQLLNYRGLRSDYPFFKAGWPRDYPYAWFVYRLQARCHKFDYIVYDASELKGTDGLLIRLIRSDLGDTISELQLLPDATTPAVSSVSFVFTDFADFKSRDALNLVWLDIPFGFVLKPDQIPGAKLAKALDSSRGQGILELPTDRASWQVILHSHKLSKTIHSDELTERNLRHIFSLFPALQAFYFDRTGDMDKEAVGLIIGQAEEMKLTYLYLNDSPDYADSLAYAKGLKIKKPVQVWNEKAQTGTFRDTLLGRTNDLAASFKGSYFIESRQQNIETVQSLLPLLEKLNIAPTPPLRVAESVERL